MLVHFSLAHSRCEETGQRWDRSNGRPGQALGSVRAWEVVSSQPVTGFPAQWTMCVLQGVGVGTRNVESRGKIQSETRMSSQIDNNK